MLISSMDSTISFIEIYMPEIEKILKEECKLFLAKRL